MWVSMRCCAPSSKRPTAALKMRLHSVSQVRQARMSSGRRALPNASTKKAWHAASSSGRAALRRHMLPWSSLTRSSPAPSRSTTGSWAPKTQCSALSANKHSPRWHSTSTLTADVRRAVRRRRGRPVGAWTPGSASALHRRNCARPSASRDRSTSSSRSGTCAKCSRYVILCAVDAHLLSRSGCRPPETRIAWWSATGSGSICLTPTWTRRRRTASRCAHCAGSCLRGSVARMTLLRRPRCQRLRNIIASGWYVLTYVGHLLTSAEWKQTAVLAAHGNGTRIGCPVHPVHASVQ